jgi:hypothetical protein
MEVVELTKASQELSQPGYDGIWIELKRRKKPSPLAGRALQWLDWKLQGQLSRWLLEPKGDGETPLYVPTMRKLPAQYVVLVDKLETASLRSGCEGLGLKKVLVLCEESARASEIERELKKSVGWPFEVSLAVDSEEGAS